MTAFKIHNSQKVEQASEESSYKAYLIRRKSRLSTWWELESEVATLDVIRHDVVSAYRAQSSEAVRFAQVYDTLETQTMKKLIRAKFFSIKCVQNGYIITTSRTRIIMKEWNNVTSFLKLHSIWVALATKTQQQRIEDISWISAQCKNHE